MQELQLFDLDQYTAPPTQISEDDDGDYENPQYITPEFWGKDGGKTRVLRFLYTETMEGSAAICHISHNTGLPEARILGLAREDFHLFRAKPCGKLTVLQLKDDGKKVAKLVIDHLPKDAELLNERLGFKYIELRWAAYGGMQSQIFKLTEEKRRYGQGWASLETRMLRGKHEQFYLHYQTPGEPKRSKYVSKNKIAKIKQLVEAKSPLSEILQAIADKKKPL